MTRYRCVFGLHTPTARSGEVMDGLLVISSQTWMRPSASYWSLWCNMVAADAAIYADPETPGWTDVWGSRQASICWHTWSQSESGGLILVAQVSSEGPPGIIPAQTTTDLPPNCSGGRMLHAAGASLQLGGQAAIPPPPSWPHLYLLLPTIVCTKRLWLLHFPICLPASLLDLLCLLHVSRSRGSPAAPGHPGPPQHLKQRQQPWDFSHLHQLHR